MVVQVNCPHCASVCQVNQQYLGGMVTCGRCMQPFRVSAPSTPAQPVQTSQGGKTVGLLDGLKGIFQPLIGSEQPGEESDSVLLEFGPGVMERLAASEAASSAPPPPPPTAPPRPAAPPSARPTPVPPPTPSAAARPVSTAPPASGVGRAAPTVPWSVPPVPGLFRLDIGGATSAGRVRDRNEDSYLIQQLSWSNLDQRQEIALVVVADGMGGHNAGERASGLIIQQLGANLAGLLGGALSGQIREVSPASLCGSLLTAIKGANKAVYQKGQSEPGCRGMGATLAVVLIWNGMVVIGHVGDTRVYCLRSGRLSQLTKDQTLVSRMVEKGLLTAEEAARHPSRNEISQAVGRQPEVEPAFYQIQLMLGDWLVVACDGLHAHVDHPALEKHLREAVPSADWLAHRLVEVANQGGGSDNTTVVAIRCY